MNKSFGINIVDNDGWITVCISWCFLTHFNSFLREIGLSSRTRFVANSNTKSNRVYLRIQDAGITIDHLQYLYIDYLSRMEYYENAE